MQEIIHTEITTGNWSQFMDSMGRPYIFAEQQLFPGRQTKSYLRKWLCLPFGKSRLLPCKNLTSSNSTQNLASGCLLWSRYIFILAFRFLSYLTKSHWCRPEARVCGCISLCGSHQQPFFFIPHWTTVISIFHGKIFYSFFIHNITIFLFFHSNWRHVRSINLSTRCKKIFGSHILWLSLL